MTVPAASDIGIIVLAAGSGTRFGADKRKAQLADGRTLLEATLAAVPASFTRRLLVLKAGDDALARQFAPAWQPCFAADPASGMASSLASGITMADSWAGALIALADMPWILPGTYSALQSALMEHAIVIPCAGNRRGNPVGFRRDYFTEIARLTGDKGARSLLEKYRSDCHELETGDEGVLRDIDRPEMLA